MSKKDYRELERYRKAEKAGKIRVCDYASGDVVYVLIHADRGINSFVVERKIVEKLCFYKKMKELVFTDGTSEGVPMSKPFHRVFPTEKAAYQAIVDMEVGA